MLVVEDSAPTRKMLVNLLRQLGIDSREASNGLEALRACAAVTSKPGGSAATPFDAILMDKEMPVMDGHQATEQLRRMGVQSPIVGITANVLRVDREAFMAKGLSAHVPKPVRRQDLVQTLQSFGLCGCDPFRATDRTARGAAEATQTRERAARGPAGGEEDEIGTPTAMRRETASSSSPSDVCIIHAHAETETTKALT